MAEGFNFNNFNFDFSKNPLQNTLAAIIGVLIAVWGLYAFIYAPKMRDIKNFKAEVKIVNQEIMLISGTKDLSKEKLGETKELLQKELEDLSRKIPIEKEVPYLLNNFINQVGKGLTIDIKLIQPMGVISEKRYKKIPIKVEFESSYYNFDKYLEQLKNLPATIRIDNLDLFKVDKYNRISVRMELSAFAVPGGELPEQEKEAIDLSKLYDPFFPKATAPTTRRRTVTLPNLTYSGFLEGKTRRAIINDVPLSVGESILGYTVVTIYKDRVVLKKGGKLYTLVLK